MRMFLTVGMFLSLTLVAQADTKASGMFTASRDCPAIQSIKKGTNPGNVKLEVGKSYTLLAKNKEPATHLWIEVPGAEPLQRWVTVDCGSMGGQSASQTPQGKTPAKPSSGAFFVLALSWQSSFCETKPNKPECRELTDHDAAAQQLSLHGLWPQPARNAYCGVDPALQDIDIKGRWYDLPAPSMKAETKAALDEVMPGARSVLERHEWIKHGTCYPGASAETYFADAVRLTRAVNQSAVGALLKSHVGDRVSAKALRRAFDEAFGEGAGQRVRLACTRVGDRMLLSEITIGLRGDISAGTSVADLMLASTPTDAGCPEGELDRPGVK